MVAITQTSRKQGTEWRAVRASAAYVAAHPRTVGGVSALSLATATFGPTTTGTALATAAGTAFCFYRAAPKTWDRTVGPSVSAWWRRWTFYQRKWQRAMNGCDLSKMDKSTGELRTPRLRRVRVRGSWDVLVVRILPGQTPQQYEECAEALAGVFRTDRVAIQKTAPHEIALMVERRDPFGLGSPPVPASPIVEVAESVDVTSLDVGALESGDPFWLPIGGTHVLVTGLTRAGKAGLIWNPLRQLAPLIRDGLVLINGADLKGGAEMDLGSPVFYRYARGPRGCLAMLEAVLADMERRQKRIRTDGRRKYCLSADEPLQLVMIDELLVLTSLADTQVRLKAQKLLGTLLTQGAGLGFAVIGYGQDPTTDGVPMRKLFPTRIALRLDQANHVDMVLGDGKRLLGALADQIPEDQHGVGYVCFDGVREPRRFRLGLVEDDDVLDLVAFCGLPGPTVYSEPESDATAA